LPLHLLEFLRAEVRAKEPVREHALRTRQIVDVLPRRDHLIGRERHVQTTVGESVVVLTYDGSSHRERALNAADAA
jgi:very-short-patch-repair endonuclease